MKKNEQDINRLHNLIDRYFDATSTEAEEHEMLKGLADMSLSTPKINEARAVTGFFAVEREMRYSHKGHYNGVARVAAAIAVAAIGCIAIFTPQKYESDRSNVCIAYIGDTKVTDNETVLSIMRNELDDLEEASSSMQADIEAQLSTLATEFSL